MDGGIICSVERRKRNEGKGDRQRGRKGRREGVREEGGEGGEGGRDCHSLSNQYNI